MTYIKTKITDFLVIYKHINEMKLIDVFGCYPDDTELIWQFIGQIDFENIDFGVATSPIRKFCTPNFISNYDQNAEKWQRELVSQFITNIDSVKNKPIIVDLDTNVVIDGNHKLMAMYLAGVENIKIININQ